MINKYIIGLSVLVITTGVVQCNPDYLYYYEAEGWLKLHKTPATWEEAYLSCHDEGAVLASPITKGLADTLQTMKQQEHIYRNIFVGTHALYSKGDYISIEGVPLSSMDVEVSSYGEGDCLSWENARTEYYNCTEPLSFICYKKVVNRQLTECGTFDEKYKLNQKTGSCYKVHPEKETWSQAFRICHSAGGYLVIVNDEDEAEVVKGLFPARTNQSDQVDKFSVGLAAFGKDRVWTTIRGDSIADVYNKWNSEQSSGNRGAILSNGKLDAVSADGEKLMFVCEKSPKFKRLEGPPPTKNKLKKLCNRTGETKLEIKNSNVVV